ncbi:hypothetical protein EX30DRAFT_338494 [Ascodesmis nigricans]|uniref:pH-response regulator protein palC n=1 Tax=Ascodesmis nigricans TaxID=341454 RepID=A0A4S2N425_9PEZI|nr:hypothetical protein EX30DRAFT_338494 [Ascodesmis nigricans]
MPFSFTLPTTSPAQFKQHFTSPVFPAFPIILSKHRGTVRNLLRAHKRMPPSSQPSHLPQLLTALNRYLPLIAYFAASLHSGDILPSDGPPLTTSWRSTLTTPPFHTARQRRITREGIEYELLFTLSTLAYVHTLLASSQLSSALQARWTQEQKQALLNTSVQHLLTAAGILNYAASLPRTPTTQPFPHDLSPQVFHALSDLSQAEAALIAVTKQDPYPSLLAIEKTDEFLYAPPPPPTGVRATLLSRICIAAAEHAESSHSLLSAVKAGKEEGELLPELLKYTKNLGRVAKAKACRFLGVDAEVSGRVGEGLGWLTLAKSMLSGNGEPKSKREKFEKLADAMRKERKESISDAGKGEEAAVILKLEANWTNANDAVFFQGIEAAETLAARIPGPREVNKVPKWEPEKVDHDVVETMRGSVVEDDGEDWDEGGDSEEEERGGKVPGGFEGYC